MGVVTALEVQKRNKERVNVYLDGEYAFSLTLLEAARLKKGQVLSDGEIAALQADDTIHKAYEHAIRFLSFRPRSEAEVRRNLKEKKYAEEVIDSAIGRLHSMGYLDDAAFVRYWVENRSTFKPRGPKALRYELRQKGIAQALIDEALADVDIDQDAYQAAHHKALRLRGADHKTFRTKLGSFLQRRGFDYATSRGVIEQLIIELSEEQPDFFLENSEDDE